MIPIYNPHIPDSSVRYATDAVESTWISSIGKYIELATDKLRDLSGCEYVLLTNNGTSATHLVTRSLARFEPQTKRILVPSSCYVAAYNSLIYDDNGWEIVCLDLDNSTWNMKIDSVRNGDVIFAVHNLGNIINVPKLKRDFNCTIIEDNCEGFFGSYEGYNSGSKSLCSSLSFFGNKNVTCGEGGAFLTNDRVIYEFANKLRGQGQTNTKYIHDEVGYNYRMTNIQAALLLGQLENYEWIYENKKRVFDRYKKNLNGVDGISLQQEEADTQSSMWMFGVRFHRAKAYSRSNVFFTGRGIDTRPMFYSYKNHSHLDFVGEDSNAVDINNQVVVFPSYPDLTDDEVDYICGMIKKYSNELEEIL